MAYEPRNDTLIFSQTADKTVMNSTAETTALGAGVGTQMILANSLKPGKRVNITLEGLYTIPLALTSVLTVRIKIGGQTAASISTSALFLGSTNKAFSVSTRLVCRADGTTGILVGGGSMSYTTGTNIKNFDDLDNAGVNVPIDTTVDNMVDVTFQWSSASTTRSITTKIATIMVV